MQSPFVFPQMGMMAPFNVMNKMTLAPALYIGDLDESIQEEFLYDFFSKFGAIHFVRIMRDTTTGKSRGYGFVNFINPRDAENAKQFAQYEKLGKKQIRIMFKRPIKELTTDANLFVKNIDPTVTVRELHNHFINNGNVICAKIATNNEGKSLGYGYVQFEKPEDAEKALEALQNSKLKEKELDLTRFVPKDKRNSAAPKSNIYIKDLPNLGSEQDIEKKIRQVVAEVAAGAKIKTMLVKKHPTEDKFCGFVCFEDQTGAQAAYEGLKANTRAFDANSEVYVNWHQSKAERERELKREFAQIQNQTNLFIKNLRLDVTEAEVKQAFQKFGKVTSVAVKEWGSNAQKAKFGFVAFDNVNDCKTAQSEGMKDQEIRSLYLPNATPYINLHQSKEKRSEYLLSLKRRKMQAGMMPPMDMFNRMGGMGGFPGGMPNRRFQQPYPPMFNQQNRGMNRGGPRTAGPGGKANWNRGPQNQQQGGRPTGLQDRPPRQQGGIPQNNTRPQQNVQGVNTQQKPRTQPTTTTTKPTTQAPTSTVTVQSLKTKLNEFLALDEDKQRQILGELLFPLIRARAPENLAPKITGMLIDLSVLEVTEILEFLEDPELLAERVSEASELLLAAE
jgi:polyadenylate-binding protein